MNNILVVHYDPFSAESRVYICRDDSQQQTVIDSNISEFAKNIGLLADATNIFSVKIDAPSHVVEEIRQQLIASNYTKQKIEVEGI